MKTFTQDEIINLLFDAYTAGIAKGQLIMEQERENEELFDGFIGSITARRTAMPSNPTERRMLHSDKRFEAMRKEAMGFSEILKKATE